MSSAGMSSAMIAGILAGLHRLHLLRRNKRVELLLCGLVDLANLLLPLLWAEGRIGTYGFDFGAGPLLDGPTLLHGRPGDAGFFPARWLVRMRRTGDPAGMNWRELLHTNRNSLSARALAQRRGNDDRQEARAEGKSASRHTNSSGWPEPHTLQKVARRNTR
jgi:hypothetical protein